MAPDSSEMMREPDTDMPQAQTLQRKTETYASHNDRFALDKKIYGQYFQLYYHRLMLLLPRLKLAVASKWPSSTLTKVLDLKEGEECVITGTLYKEMRLKPCVLDEYGKDLTLGVDLRRENTKKFTQDDDSLILEDEGARVRLVGKIVDPKLFVTGVVLACKGKVVQDGEFEVTNVCFAEPAPQKKTLGISEKATSEKASGSSPQGTPSPGNYVVLVSGLRVGDVAVADPLQIELFLDYVTGNLGGDKDQAAAANILRVVIAGGALSEPEAAAKATGGAGQSSGQTQHAANARAALRSLDQILTQLTSAVPVDLMPGAGDPTNQALPQQPLHPCLFPEAGRFKESTFHTTTNPHDFSVGSCEFLGTSGQNIDNLRQYTEVASGAVGGTGGTGSESLALMSSTLRWQHVAPSAPDTLACYPYKDRDPFYVQNTPNVYFCGNQPEFGAQVVRVSESSDVKTLLVSVPNFATTGTIAMVNVDTLECFPVVFKVA